MIILGLALFWLGALEASALGFGDPLAWSTLGGGASAWLENRPLGHGIAAALLWGAAAFAMTRSRLWMDLLTQGGRDHSRLWPRLLGTLLVGGGLYLVTVQMDEFRNLATRTTDFRTFMEAARAAGTGAGPYAATDGGYFYPPPFAHLMRPLARLPLGLASTVWLAFKSAILVAMVVRIRSFLGRDLDLLQLRWFTWGLLIGTARFWLADLAFGNSNLVVTALVVMALLADHDGHSRRAGVALGTAVIIKVVPLALVPGLLVCRRWRTLAWTGGTVVALVVVSLVMAGSQGLHQWQAYYQEGVVAKLGESLAQPDNQSLRGLAERLLGGGLAARLAWVFAAGAVLSAATWASWRACTGDDDRARRLAAALWPAVVLLVSPGSWVVHYVMVMLPFAALLSLLLAEPRSRLLQATFVAVNIAFTVSGWSRPTVRWSIQQSWFVLALVLVFVVLIQRIRALTASRSAT